MNYSDLKKLSSNFKAVYNAPNEIAALSDLEDMEEKWRRKYPYAISGWENNWDQVLKTYSESFHRKQKETCQDS